MKAQGTMRIAAADWAAAETMLACGVVPIAICETSLYRQWLSELALPNSVADLGARTEPNLELLASLKPDRIYVSNWQRSLAGLFEQIAPTRTVSIIDGRRRPLANAKDALTQVAIDTGAQDVAERYMVSHETALASYASRLSGQSRLPVYIGVLHENGSQIFVYGEGSWVHDVITTLGLQNALKKPTSAFGNALLDLGQLMESPEAILLYLDQGERTRRAERRLRRSTLWSRLPMVRESRVRPIQPFYALGGVPSVRLCARSVVQGYLSRSWS